MRDIGLNVLSKTELVSGRGGGVMLYVANELESYECDPLSGIDESCWYYIKSGCDKILVGVIYRSPNSIQIDNRRLVECIKSVRDVDSILIMVICIF